MATAYNCADSAIEVLKELNLFYDKNWLPVSQGLRFLRTFLSYIPKWSDADEGVRQRLGDLVSRIEEAFAEEELQGLCDAAEEGDEGSLEAVRFSLLEKIDLFKPEIKKAYYGLSEYISECKDPLIDYHKWKKFMKYSTDAIEDLAHEEYLTDGAKKQFEVLAENLQLLRSFIFNLVHGTNSSKQFLDLWVHFHLGTLAIYAACVSCSYWDDNTDDNRAKELTLRASNLLQKIKPTTTDALQMYLKVMKRVVYWHQGYIVNKFLQFLLPMKVRAGPIINLQVGLEFLVTFVLSTPEEHSEYVEPISFDIKSAIAEAGLLQLTSIEGNETDVSLYLLLQKIELLKLEIVLMQLIGRATDTLELPKMEVRFMRILSPIEAVAEKVIRLYSLFHSKQITDDMVKDALELLVAINLLKAEAFFMELMMNYNAGMDLFRNQIETLHEGLEYLRKFLLGPQQHSPNAGKVMIDTVAREAISLYYSLHSDLVTCNPSNDKNQLFSKLLEKVNRVKAEAQDAYLNIRSSSTLNFPKTDGMGFVDFFLKNLRQLLEHKSNSMDYVRHQIRAVLKELESVATSIEAIGKQCKHQTRELKDVCADVANVAYQTDYAIDSILLENGAASSHMLSLSDSIHRIKLIKAKVEKMNERGDIDEDRDTGLSSIAQIGGPLTSQISSSEIEEVVPVLEDQEKLVIDRLKSGTPSLDIVPIVGMAGSGKTTLAKKVYDNIKNHFHVHAWCSVSQAYRKGETLLNILGDIIELTDEVREKPEDDLVLLLCQRLRRNKYIIVLDDVWDSQAWNDLGSAFPDHHNGSRILLTSRDSKVALEAKDDSIPIHLRPLSADESWKFLEKLFSEESCDKELLQTGRLIAESCKGLPLAVVAIAGILKRTKMNVDRLKKIAEDLNSHILEDEESMCKHILDQSYNNLPDDLKPCFLYFGAFEQGKEVPVQKLIWLWIAEGFVSKVDKDSILEDAAEAYLLDLIARSLVMADRRGSMGSVKTCRMHDTLHKFCRSKVEEQNFLQSTFWYDKHFSSSHSISYTRHRVSICSTREHFVSLKPSGPHVRSLLFSATSDKNPRYVYDVSFICCNFKLLRVLDIESINVGNSFPKGIEFLDPLRYLAVCGYIDFIPSSIAKLWRLETLLVKGLGGRVALPESIWSLAMLRQLRVNDIAIFSLPEKYFKNSQLHNLVTLSSPRLRYGKDTEKILKNCPRLRKMRCIFSESPNVSGNCNRFPVLNFLNELVSLHISYHGNVHRSCEFSFPLNLKKLTLSDFRLPWDCITVIGKLPQLQVLKLVSHAFDGPTWDMKDGTFPKLKFLKIRQFRNYGLECI